MKRFNGRPAEILLVEDNPGDVILTQEAFATAKIRNHIHVAKDGEVALQMLHKEGQYADAVTPDLILLDLNLPKKDGRQVLEEIKQQPKLRRIPVVVLTSSQAERDVIKTYDLHANSYITKPVDLEQFMRVVQSIERFWFTVVVLPAEDASESEHV